MNIAIAGLLWALLPTAALAFEIPLAAGILGGFIGALTPTNHWMELNGYWESTAAGLALMLGVMATTRLWRQPLSNASHAQRYAPVFTMLVVMLVTLTPWTARNYRTMGGVVFDEGISALHYR